MRQLITILITILILFAESFLLDIPFITANPLRIAIVVILFIITIIIGFRFVQIQSTPQKKE